MTETRFRGEPLDRFLELVASDTPAPGGGAVTAVTTALAAGLLAMVARFSTRQMADAVNLAAQADQLRVRAIDLAGDDARAYQDVLAAYALPKDSADRKTRIRAALERAADVPLQIAEIAAEGTTIGARLIGSANPNLKGDAIVGVLLAQSAVRGAVTLVQLNVRMGNLDRHWIDRSAAHLATAVDTARAVDVAARKDG
jgi:formiminotetrahydrofolate cyclodeaminase